MLKDLIYKIQALTEPELQIVMHAIEARYATLFPQWDVLYIAVHNDPAVRKRELTQIWEYLNGEQEPPKHKRESAKI